MLLGRAGVGVVGGRVELAETNGRRAPGRGISAVPFPAYWIAGPVLQGRDRFLSYEDEWV